MLEAQRKEETERLFLSLAFVVSLFSRNFAVQLSYDLSYSLETLQSMERTDLLYDQLKNIISLFHSQASTESFPLALVLVAAALAAGASVPGASVLGAPATEVGGAARERRSSDAASERRSVSVSAE